MEKTFQEVMNTIKEGETWINKYDDRRLAKIEKSSNVIHFKFNGEFEKIGVMLDDIFVLDKKKYTFEEAMKALKEGKEIESCYSEIKYVMSPKGRTVQQRCCLNRRARQGQRKCAPSAFRCCGEDHAAP